MKPFLMVELVPRIETRSVLTNNHLSTQATILLQSQSRKLYKRRSTEQVYIFLLRLGTVALLVIKAKSVFTETAIPVSRGTV
jgi:hypothetical protein